MTKDITAAPNNPLAWYKLHSDDVGTITRAVTTGKQIANAGTGDNFGVGLRLNYDQQTGFTIYGGAQFKF